MNATDIIAKYNLEHFIVGSGITFYVPSNLVAEVYPLTRTIDFIMRYRQVAIEALDKEKWIFKYVEK